MEMNNYLKENKKMQVFDTSKIRIIDVSKKIVPFKKDIACDDFVGLVLEEAVIWPLEIHDSFIDDSIYQIVKFKSHLKTHIESPYHLDGKGIPLSDFAPDTFIGRMVYFNFDVPAGTIITRDLFEKMDNGRLKGGDIVVAHSSWKGKEEGPIPNINQACAEYLIEKKIKMFGLDDSVAFFISNEDTAHGLLLKNNIPLLEMLCNLDKISQDISFMIALPGLLKVEGIDSSPVQAIILEGMEVI
jgi:arylformamidase